MVGHLDIYTANPTAAISLTHDNGQAFDATAVDGHAVIGPFDLPDGNGATLVVDGETFRGVLWVSQLNPVNGSATFGIDTFPAFTPPLPPVPSRDQVCAVRMHFQGAQVQTDAYGLLPLFQPVMTSPGLSQADRERIYQATAGDTHYNLSLSWRYAEPGQAYTNIPGRDLSQDLPTFRTYVVEAIQHGRIPLITLAGDGNGAGPGYNDPGGWTYGHDWLMANLARILDGLKDVRDYCLFVPGYDAIFYGWSPAQVKAFVDLFRQLYPNGHLGLEFSIGISHLGNGAADYAPGGTMQGVDVVLSEFDWPVTGDGIWQIAARLLGSAYKRPADEPAADDPPPTAHYLAVPTPRGPYYAVFYERGLYNQVRNQATVADIDKSRAYGQSVGYQYWG